MRNILMILIVFGVFTWTEIVSSQDKEKMIWLVEVTTPSGIDKFEAHTVDWLQSGGSIVGIEAIDTNGFKRYYKSDRFSLISKKIYKGSNAAKQNPKFTVPRI